MNETYHHQQQLIHPFNTIIIIYFHPAGVNRPLFPVNMKLPFSRKVYYKFKVFETKISAIKCSVKSETDKNVNKKKERQNCGRGSDKLMSFLNPNLNHKKYQNFLSTPLDRSYAIIKCFSLLPHFIFFKSI